MATRLTSNRPKLETPILWGMAAGIAWTISGYTIARWATSIAYIATFAALAGLILSGIDYLTFTVARRWSDYQTAFVAGEVTRLQTLIAWNHSVSAMDSEHLAYAGKLRPTIKIIPGHNTPPLYVLVLENGVEPPMEFVREFCQLSAGLYLVERRRWSEGSAQHKWADAITLSFLRNGYATDSAGNKPARWVSEKSREAALYSIGVLRDEDE